MFSLNKVFGLFLACQFMAAALSAQSPDQNYPSPVTESEISATIKARDIGDARLTTHFWAFDGAAGDIFINVVTENFSGDIDIYLADGLRPLTKMVMFADAGVSETGRVIYVRQPARLLLRIEGRSPNDDPATYRIKFGGSFVALAPEETIKPPTVGAIQETGVNVNSVGTIIAAAPPKPTPTPVEKEENVAIVPVDPPAKRAENEEQPELPQSTPVAEEEKPGVKTIFGNKSAKVTVTSTVPEAPDPPVKKVEPVSKPARPKREPQPDPMAGIRLIVTFKDGHIVEKSMSEVLRFSYDRGFLTVTRKDGKIDRFTMTDVASVVVH